jgi:hypothetical protein
MRSIVDDVEYIILGVTLSAAKGLGRVSLWHLLMIDLVEWRKFWFAIL